MTCDVVVGCPVANRMWIFPEWFEAISASVKRAGVRAQYVFVTSGSHDGTEEFARKIGVALSYTSEPSRSEDRDRDHLWGERGEFERMAMFRNVLRRYAISTGAPRFLSLDSDIIAPLDGLNRLLDSLDGTECNAVSPLVDMRPDDPGRIWNFMCWGNIEAHAERQFGPEGQEAPPFLARADVIMAAMLLDQKAMQVPWVDHPQGEDVGWSWAARQQGVEMGIDPQMTWRHVWRSTRS